MAAQGQAAAAYFRGPGEVNDPNGPQFIDYSLEVNKKAYKYAVTGLSEKFDLSPQKLQGFLNRVNERVAEQNWNNIINITFPVPPAAAGQAAPPARAPINLITNYGQVSSDQVRTHSAVFMAVQQRNSQNSLMLYMFLSNSLDTTAHNVMDINPEKYRINGENEGVLFLKEIINKAYVDTNATVDTIRKAISKLDDKIKEMKFDIKAFNTYVQTQVNALNAHGIECTELVTNLFAAYKQVPDNEFLQHVQMYYFQYTSANARGQNQNQDITTELMLVMEQTYHRRMDDNTWNLKVVKTDKERIIALESTIAELKAVPPAATDTKRSERGKSSNNSKWAWKTVPPKAGEPKTIKRGTPVKTYHWCPKHEAWCIHTPEACEKVVANETTVAPATPSNTTTNILKADPVLQSIVNGGPRVFT
jgi:hypothetical protein